MGYGLPEQIDNNKFGVPKSAYEKQQKRQAHKHERRQVKESLNNGDEPVSHYGKYQGWTT